MKKYGILLISQLFLFIIILFTCIYYVFLLEVKVDVSFKNNIVLEINTEAYNSDYVEEIENGTIAGEKELIDTSSLGSHKVRVVIKDKMGNEKNYYYNVLVNDTVDPVITFKDKIITDEGVKVDLLKEVTVKDNSNEKIEVTVEGKYDFSASGTYTLYYVARDSSENETRERFTLVVKEKEVEEIKEDIVKDTSFTTSKGFSGYTKNGITYINGILIVNKTYSLPSTYNPGLNGNVKSQANKMFEDAKKEGFAMYIGSGFRSYKTQKTIYNNYVKRDGVTKADTYSARPGHSEHQAGLAFDVCNPGYSCITSKFDDTPPAKWLNDNAYKYGFIIRYPKGKTNETGYKYESWHLRYVGEELATKLYNNGDWITLESYFGITSKYNY